MVVLTSREALAKIERRLAHYETSPLANRCLTCGHSRHNELGYCQIGQCACGDGTTLAGLAGIIRRDLRESVIDAATLADDEGLVERYRYWSEPRDMDAENAKADFRALAAAFAEQSNG